VRAIDQAGNTDGSPATFNWTIDTVAPDTLIGSKPPALTNSAAASFTFTGTDPGGSGIGSFQCRLDSTNPADWEPCTSPEDLTGLPEGPHTFEVRAIDNAGNVDQSPATHSWTIDTGAPQAPDLTATVPASPANYNTPEIVGSALAGTTVRLYSGADCTGAPIATATPAQLEAGIEASVADNSSTDFRATATTPAGNTSGCSAPVTYLEDSGSPNTQIGQKPSALSNSSAASFTFTGSDTGGAGLAPFQCRRDSEVWSACSSPKAYSSLSDGAHSFEVRAIDQAGNVDQSPAEFNWVIDTSVPQPPDESPTPGPESAGSARFLRMTLNAKSGTALLIFEVPGPGQLSAHAPELTFRRAKSNSSSAKAIKIREERLRLRRIRPRSIRIMRAGTVKVPIRLAPAGQRLLRKSHSLKVKVVIRFRSTDGSSATWKLTVNLKQKAPPRKGTRRAG
jgi:hypothetical protein